MIISNTWHDDGATAAHHAKRGAPGDLGQPALAEEPAPGLSLVVGGTVDSPRIYLPCPMSLFIKNIMLRVN